MEGIAGIYGVAQSMEEEDEGVFVVIGVFAVAQQRDDEVHTIRRARGVLDFSGPRLNAWIVVEERLQRFVAIKARALSQRLPQAVQQVRGER